MYTSALPYIWPFQHTGSSIGTWRERYSDAQATASGFNSFDPHRRSTLLWEQDESNTVPTTDIPEQAKDQEQRISTHDRAQQPHNFIALSRSDSLQPPDLNDKERLEMKSSALKLLKHKKSAQQKMQSRWRDGNGPSKSLVLPAEHPHTQFETVLRQCSNIY